MIKENIQHHVKEEEKELFPQVKELLLQEKLTTLSAGKNLSSEQKIILNKTKIKLRVL